MLTFYNDLNLVYATTPPEGNSEQQEAWRQTAPQAGQCAASAQWNHNVDGIGGRLACPVARLIFVDDWVLFTLFLALLDGS